MTKSKFRVGDEVTILDKTYSEYEEIGLVNWYGLKRGDIVTIVEVLTHNSLPSYSLFSAGDNKHAYRSNREGAIFWESDLTFFDENMRKHRDKVDRELKRIIKILEERFKIDIKYTYNLKGRNIKNG